MDQINLDSMYSAACLRKTNEVSGLEKILEFINFIQQVEIEAKYSPFEKPFIKIEERSDQENETNKSIFLGDKFLQINKVI